MSMATATTAVPTSRQSSIPFFVALISASLLPSPSWILGVNGVVPLHYDSDCTMQPCSLDVHRRQFVDYYHGNRADTTPIRRSVDGSVSPRSPSPSGSVRVAPRNHGHSSSPQGSPFPVGETRIIHRQESRSADSSPRRPYRRRASWSSPRDSQLDCLHGKGNSWRYRIMLTSATGITFS